MDLEKFAVIAARECVRQEATEISDLMYLLMAYNGMMRFDKCGYLDTPEGVFKCVLQIGDTVKGGTTNGFRAMPVIFQNGGSSSNPTDIKAHMERLCTIVAEQRQYVGVEDAYGLTRSFLQIHPFRDGNGRTAWILYNWLNRTLEDPVPLPDFNF